MGNIRSSTADSPAALPGPADSLCAVSRTRTMVPERRVAMLVLIVLVGLAGLVAGIRVRRAVWDATVGARKSEDIENGYQWGQRALAHRFFGLYDHVVAH